MGRVYKHRDLTESIDTLYQITQSIKRTPTPFLNKKKPNNSGSNPIVAPKANDRIHTGRHTPKRFNRANLNLLQRLHGFKQKGMKKIASAKNSGKEM